MLQDYLFINMNHKHFHNNKPPLISIAIAPLGVISIGVVPMGVISIGVVPMGVVSIGSVAMGVFSAGLVSMGTVAAGVQTMGIVSIGSMGMGNIRVPIGAEKSPHEGHNMNEMMDMNNENKEMNHHNP